MAFKTLLIEVITCSAFFAWWWSAVSYRDWASLPGYILSMACTVEIGHSTYKHDFRVRSNDSARKFLRLPRPVDQYFSSVECPQHFHLVVSIEVLKKKMLHSLNSVVSTYPFGYLLTGDVRPWIRRCRYVNNVWSETSHRRCTNSTT